MNSYPACLPMSQFGHAELSPIHAAKFR